ncbi:extra-large guanine nucleotide-binding protein 3-like [Cucumis melo var. makuwa]|uniref:Extra-large guanine nucleotide-binding protein 3-like n=2 Tax=Cucumis melo TaxID=3656 RepID=A0A5A7V259_CUCMM|nr:extra-large guanine nucleotide-binding protein 3-like [Cucumis melo var. makuwa]TYJ97234.1 extra-large guanine nucleotide-binding protein 3-like [Cucumis melo var. makuwa]
MDDGGFRKARLELEALYEGVPDDSVNLTFRHLTDVNLQPNSSFEKRRANPSIPIPIPIPIPGDNETTPLNKLPSLDFNRALQAANQHSRPDAKISLHPSAQVGGSGGPLHATAGDIQSHPKSEHEHVGGLRPALEYSAAYEEASRISGIGSMYGHHRATARSRRPGIPHSNICTNCTTYIYIFRHRCLVCGRVYCRQCVRIGMGEMTEGRKCIECLGRKFSHRYIGKAGDVGCFGWRYSSAVKQAELKWAEKGPRRKGERALHSRGYGGGVTNSISMTSPSQSPWAPTTSSVDVSTIYSSRFAVMSSSSPHSPAHRHHLPF